jgi:hypothetical protein
VHRRCTFSEGDGPDVLLPFGWAWRPDQGKTKGATYYADEFAAVVAELFDVGEEKKGCKYAPHQMHSEILARFPDRYDIPSVTEISGGVSLLVTRRKLGKVSVAKGTGKRGARLIEDKTPDVFGPLREQFDMVWDQTDKAMTPSAAMRWLTSKKPGTVDGNWPAALAWPGKMEQNMKTVLKRWVAAKKQPAAE